MIRAASLRGFASLVEELGGDVDSLLARFAMSRALLASDDALVSITAHDRLIDATADELGCRDFGLRMAESQDVSMLGPLAVVITSSSTVAEALSIVSKFLFVHSPALSIGVQPDPRGRPGVVALTYRKDVHESPYSPQAMELGLGVFFRVAVMLVGERTGLRSVEFPHQPISPIRRYTEFFGVDVKFGAATGALRVERRLLDERFTTANEAIRQVAVDYLASNFADPGATVASRVRRTLAQTLGASRPAIGGVAALLATHPRTLQRHLAAEGTTFEATLDEVRRDAAHRYLTTTDLPIGDVALMVGFSEQSTLSHASRRWFGVSPRDLRSDAREAEQPATALSR